MRAFLFCMLVACSPAEDPELVSYRKALEAYDQGQVQLANSQLTEALQSFEQAQRARPGDVLIGAWIAKVLAEQGELEAAVEQLDRVLKARGSFSEARYNRASYLARIGRFESAAIDVKRLISSEVYSPEAFYEDEDFSKAVVGAAFHFLPKPILDTTLKIPEHRVVVGTEVPITVGVSSKLDLGTMSLSGVISGPIELLKVIENSQEREALLVWSVRVAGPGVIRVGPLSITAPNRDPVVLSSSEFESWSASEGTPVKPIDLSLRLPTTIVGERIAPAAWREGTSVFVLTNEGQKVTVKADLEARPIRYERRQNGIAAWVLWEYPNLATTDVDVRERGKMVLEARR